MTKITENFSENESNTGYLSVMRTNTLIALFLLSFSGWFFSIYLINVYMQEQRQEFEVVSTENAYNIVAQALQDKVSNEDVIETMQVWFDQGWTAQTGSVTTLCTYGRDRLKTILNDEGVATVCRLRI